jgi:hypothetical protein
MLANGNHKSFRGWYFASAIIAGSDQALQRTNLALYTGTYSPRFYNSSVEVAMPFHLYQNANSVHFVRVVAKTQITLMLAFGCAKSTDTTTTRLSALGDARLDVVELDVVSVVGLDVGGETVEGALDGLLGGAVHHAGL